MDLTKILSIAGRPGLFMMIGEAKNNIVVESFIDGKKGPAFPHERISSLQEISIFTETDDVALYDVLKNIYELYDGKEAINPKKASSKELKELFEKVVPGYDQEAVYISDMKKVFGWYNALLEKDILEFTEEEETGKEAGAEEGIKAEAKAEAEEGTEEVKTEQETTETDDEEKA